LRRRGGERDEEFEPGPRIPKAGEILTDDEALYVLQLREAPRQMRSTRVAREEVVETLTLFYIGPPRLTQNLALLQQNLESSCGLKFEHFFYSARRFDELKTEGREPPAAPTSEELAAAELLKDKLA